MEYKAHFERDFIQRTLEVVRTYTGPYEATNLLNCLLGLLIVPSETSLKKIPQDDVSELHRWGISPTSIENFGTIDGKPAPHTVQRLVLKLRNAVAHFRFEPRHQDGKCIGFKFTDRDGFRAAINLDEMRIFVEKLAEHLDKK